VASKLERKVRDHWVGESHYARFGVCSRCGRTEDDDGKPLYLRGKTYHVVTCLRCFDERGLKY
jgi:hypothetical protein